MTSSATEQPPRGLLNSPLEELIRLVLAIAPVVVEDPAVAVAARASARVAGDQLGGDGLFASRSCNVCTRMGTAALPPDLLSSGTKEPHSPRPGSYPAMEAGRRVRSSGIPRPPPSRNGAHSFGGTRALAPSIFFELRFEAADSTDKTRA